MRWVLCWYGKATVNAVFDYRPHNSLSLTGRRLRLMVRFLPPQLLEVTRLEARPGCRPTGRKKALAAVVVLGLKTGDE